MTKWILVLVMPGGFLLGAYLGANWLRRRWLARERQSIASLIKTPRVCFLGTDDVLRIAREKRRQAAHGMRSRASKVESGTSVSDLLRAVK